MVQKYTCVRWCTDSSNCTIVQPMICKKFSELNIKLLKARIRAKKVVNPFATIVFFVKFSWDIFTAFIPLEFGMLV